MQCNVGTWRVCKAIGERDYVCVTVISNQKKCVKGRESALPEQTEMEGIRAAEL